MVARSRKVVADNGIGRCSPFRCVPSSRTYRSVTGHRSSTANNSLECGVGLHSISLIALPARRGRPGSGG